jgi:polyhydroxyalkanoate synthesis regulator protein
MAPSSDLPPIPVHRYAASGFYDTIAMSYLSELVLLAWAAVGVSFVVLDAETGQDVTNELSPGVVTGLPERAPEMMPTAH